MIAHIPTRLKRISIYIMLHITVLSIFFAPIISVQACTPTPVNISNIFTPAAFLPIIPLDCGIQNGQPAALTIEVLPAVLIRAFGFMASMVVYLLFFIVVFSGIQWIYGGIDGNSTRQAKKNLEDAVAALVLILGTYILLNTLLVVLRVPALSSKTFADFINTR